MEFEDSVKVEPRLVLVVILALGRDCDGRLRIPMMVMGDSDRIVMGVSNA